MKLKIGSWRIRAIAIGVALAISINLVVLSFLIVLHYSSSNILQKEAQTRELTTQSLLTGLITSRIDYVIADLLHLVDMFERICDDPCSSGQTIPEEIATDWVSFSNRKFYYHKIRFIDRNGMEMLRVDYDEEGSFKRPDEDLQNKSDRYFFNEAIKAKPGQVYISKIDLNMDNEQIQEPIVPTLRFAAAIRADNGDKGGIIVVNYSLEELLATFERVALSTASNNLWLNNNGYYLFNRDEPERTWGFMYKDRLEETFINDKPDIWQDIQNEDNNFIYYPDGFYTFTKISKQSITERMVSQADYDLIISDDLWYILSEIVPGNEGWYVFEKRPLKVLAIIFERQKPTLLIGLIFSLIFLQIWLMNIRSRSKLHKYSYDQLTGALARHSGLDMLSKQVKEAANSDTPITICFLDINGLKQVNDTFGHEAGDELIKIVSTTVKECIRHSDYLIRLGGDEFLIVFYDSDIENSALVWQRINSVFNDLNQEMIDLSAQAEDKSFSIKEESLTDAEKRTKYKRNYLISVSHGFELIDPQTNYSLDKAISNADSQMYDEKRRLKDCLNIIRS